MKKFFASLVALALGLGLALASISPATADPGNGGGPADPGNGGGAPDPTNSEDYWETPLTGEVCAKIDNPGGGTLKTWSLSSVTLAAGREWTKVIIKSGHTDDQQTYLENNGYFVNPTYKYPNPEATTLWTPVASLTAQSFGHSTNKDISHVIYCSAPVLPSAVRGSAAVTDENCAYVDGYITVTITPGVGYLITRNSDAAQTPIVYDPTNGKTGLLPAGGYTVAVSVTGTAYTLVGATSIPLTIDPYPSNCSTGQPEKVRGNAVSTPQDCDLDYIDGDITVTLRTGVDYVITKDSDLSQTPIAYSPTSGRTAALAPGGYTVAVSATGPAYELVSDSSIRLTIAPYTLACGQNSTDPLTTATASSVEAGCEVTGSYELSSEQGPGDVLWKADGLAIAAGTHSLPAGQKVTITVSPAAGYGFAFDQRTSWVFGTSTSALCGELSTLALTGGGNSTPYLLAASLLGLLGAALVRAARPRKA